MNVWQLINMTDEQIAARFPATRKFFANGFRIARDLISDDVVGFVSPNQRLIFNLNTGDLTNA